MTLNRRTVRFVLGLTAISFLLNGCTYYLWKNHDWTDRVAVEKVRFENEDGTEGVRTVFEERVQWGESAGKVVATPFAVALDACAAAAVLGFIYLLIRLDLEDDDHDCD